jgi:SpoVK/Ycf46/Vps4 family AAA+-type ATPase
MPANFELDLLDVGGLDQASMAEDAITSLVMEDNNKEMIKAIARTYTDSDPSSRFSADFIHGKGEGQIILLHGPPGTGKTLTAGKASFE